MSTKPPQATPPLFDVVIYEIATQHIDAVIGKNMPLDDGTGSGRNTADLRKQTGRERINEHFDVAIVPANTYSKGGTLNKRDIV